MVEFTDAIAAGADSEISRTFKRYLEMQGVKFKLQTKVTGVEKQKDGSVKVSVQDLKTEKTEIVRTNHSHISRVGHDFFS